MVGVAHRYDCADHGSRQLNVSQNVFSMHDVQQNVGCDTVHGQGGGDVLQRLLWSCVWAQGILIGWVGWVGRQRRRRVCGGARGPIVFRHA
jgi:hypothetical protein